MSGFLSPFSDEPLCVVSKRKEETHKMTERSGTSESK